MTVNGAVLTMCLSVVCHLICMMWCTNVIFKHAQLPGRQMLHRYLNLIFGTLGARGGSNLLASEVTLYSGISVH